MFLIILALNANSWSEEPFWRSKEKVYAKVQEREVIVAVNTEDVKAGVAPRRLSIKGGGQMRTPCDFAFGAAQNYPELARESGYVEEVSYQADEGLLKLKMAAFGFRESATLKMSAGQDGEHKAIFYEIMEGRLTGFKGRFVFYPVRGRDKQCDIGTLGEFNYRELPLPRMFVTFGLQVMFQRMAGRLRAFAEEKYRTREHPNGPGST